MAMRSEKSGEYGERGLLGLHLGIYLTFGSDLGWTVCGMIAWFGPFGVFSMKKKKRRSTIVRGSLGSRLRLP